MKGGRFLQGMQGFSALHARTVEHDFARRARERARLAEQEMQNAAPSGLLGTGRVADEKDAADAGLFEPNGLFLGAFDGRLMFFDGDGPLLTYLRTGGGKGRDLLLPNMAHVRGRSLVIVDVKDGENAYASWAHRSATIGSKCVALNPFGVGGLPNTRINPLQILLNIVSAGADIDTEAVEIAQILLPAPPKEGENAWVRKGAVRLLAVRMEYLARFDADQCTLSGLWRFVNAGADDLDTSFAVMATCGVEGIERRAAALHTIMQNAPKQFEGYRADATDALSAYEPGKALARATSGHDIDFARLKHEAHTVYLVLPSDKLDVAAPWISLVLNYAIETIAKERGPIRTTFFLDEFPQLPASPAIMKSLRLYRAKSVQLWLFAQGRYSLEGRWSRDAVKEFEDQATVMTMKAVQEPGLLKDIGVWSGNKTVLMRGVSHNGGTVESASANHGESRRDVLQSEDILGLGSDRQIIKVAGMPRLFIANSVPFFAVDPWRSQLRDVRDLHSGRAQ